jgi:hypothetical protein
MDLSAATIEDMVAELERRGMAAALCVSHVMEQHFTPSPDVPAEDRERVYATSWFAKHPAFRAHFLCNGIQWCLHEIDPQSEAQGGVCVHLSNQVRSISIQLEKLVMDQPGRGKGG